MKKIYEGRYIFLCNWCRFLKFYIKNEKFYGMSFDRKKKKKKKKIRKTFLKIWGTENNLSWKLKCCSVVYLFSGLFIQNFFPPPSFCRNSEFQKFPKNWKCKRSFSFFWTFFEKYLRLKNGKMFNFTILLRATALFFFLIFFMTLLFN